MSPQNTPSTSSGLRLLEQTLPSWSWASDDKVADEKMPREKAVNHRYIQINTRNLTNWLIFDLDHGNAMIYEDKNMPVPNLIVRNRKNGHSHLFYAIEPVSTSEKSRRHPADYLNYVREWMKGYLEADKAYSGGPLAKNPLHPHWFTTDLHGNRYSLGEIMEYYPTKDEKADKEKRKQDQAKKRGKPLEDNGSSRHVALFNLVRRFAYDNVSDFRANNASAGAFMDALVSFAESRNDFDRPLPCSSIKSTARSVSRWVWKKYTGASAKTKSGKRIDRGVMELQSTGYPLHYKQRLAALRTASIKRGATEQRIHKACEQLHRDNQLSTASRSAIASLSKITRQGIQRYCDFVDNLRCEFNRMSLEKYQFHFISSLCQPSWTSGIGADIERDLHRAEGEETERADMADEGRRDSWIGVVRGFLHGRGIWSKQMLNFCFLLKKIRTNDLSRVPIATDA